MQAQISDNNQEYVYKNVNFIKINGEDFVINYHDENDEECEEIGPIPSYIMAKEEL